MHAPKMARQAASNIRGGGKIEIEETKPGARVDLTEVCTMARIAQAFQSPHTDKGQETMARRGGEQTTWADKDSLKRNPAAIISVRHQWLQIKCNSSVALKGGVVDVDVGRASIYRHG